MPRRTTLSSLLLTSILLAGCTAKTSHTSPTAPTVTRYLSGPTVTLVVGDISNQTDYARGLFSAAGSQPNRQAKTMLTTYLQQGNVFKLVDRANKEAALSESEYLEQQQRIQGARYLVTGSITESGRKEIGHRTFFGLLGSGKQHIAYATVQLSLIDVLTSEVVLTTQGSGEYNLTEQRFLGSGSTVGFDATLTGKATSLAMRNAVDTLMKKFISHPINAKK